MTSPPISIAANNGSIGGGEVMLLNIAQALRELDETVNIVAPDGEDGMSELVNESRRRGFDVTALPAANRLEWMRQLRSWDARERTGWLWCNGLVPAAATAGHPDRIVHLHQRPQSRAQRVLLQLARPRALKLIVPSNDMAAVLPAATVLSNWNDEVVVPRRDERADGPKRIGFLGRTSREKGIETLAAALAQLDAAQPGEFRLVIAGSAKFVDPESAASVDDALRPVQSLVQRLGWVSPDELFSQIDVLSVPSIAPESFGLVAAEAMSARVPVVVSDAGALPEVVGVDGTVTPAGDPNSLAQALLAATSSAAENARVDTLRDRWEKLYSPEAGRARVAELLAELRS